MIAEPFLFLFLIYPKPDLNGGSIRKWQDLKTLPLPFRSTKGKVNSSP
jgi:hypothetical protein